MTDERERRPHHPDSAQVGEIREAEALVVFTPRHGARAFLDWADAVPGAVLPMVCPRDGRRWQVELVGDASQDSGLHAGWSDPSVDGRREPGRGDS